MSKNKLAGALNYINLNKEKAFLGIDGVYHYLYKITNIINNKFYYGVHSTRNLNDNYLGSGTYLHKAYKKYGINSFNKVILEYFYTEEEMLQREFEIVNEELVLSENCYNVSIGGGRSLFNQTIVKDNKENIYRVSLDDPRLKTGELVGIAKNTITVKDKAGNNFRISKETYEKNKDIYFPTTTGKVIVHDKNMNTLMVDKNDPRLKTGELTFLLKTLNKEMTTVKDINGNCFRVNKNDPRLKTGELVGITKNQIVIYKDNQQKFINPEELENYELDGWKKHCLNKGKCKVLKNNVLKTISIEELENYELDGWIRTNKTKGKISITKDNKNKRINPEELENYELDGWKKGFSQKPCKDKFAINKNRIKKFINPEELENYELDGWKKGFKSKM